MSWIERGGRPEIADGTDPAAVARAWIAQAGPEELSDLRARIVARQARELPRAVEQWLETPLVRRHLSAAIRDAVGELARAGAFDNSTTRDDLEALSIAIQDQTLTVPFSSRTARKGRRKKCEHPS